MKHVIFRRRTHRPATRREANPDPRMNARRIECIKPRISNIVFIHSIEYGFVQVTDELIHAAD